MSNGHDPPKFLDHPLFGRSYTLRLPQEEPKEKEKRPAYLDHPLFTRSFGYERPPPPAGFVGPPDLRAHLPPSSAAELQRQEIDTQRDAQETRRAGLTPLYSGEVDVDAGMPGTAVKPIPPGRLDPWKLSPSGGTMGARGPGHRELEKPWSPIIEVPLAIAQVMANTSAEMVKWGLENEHEQYQTFVDNVNNDGLLSAWKADMAQEGTAMKETLTATVQHVVAQGPQMVAGAYGMSGLFYQILGDEDAAAWAEYYRTQAARAVFQIENAYIAETPGGQFGSVATGFAIGVVPYLVGGAAFRKGLADLAIPAGAGLFGRHITNPKTQRFLLSLAEPVKLRYRMAEDFATGGPIDALMAAGDKRFSTISMLADLSMTERGRRIFRDAGFDPEAFADQMWAIAEDDRSRILLEPVLGAAIASLPITVMHKAGARGRAMRIEEAEARMRKAAKTRGTLHESMKVTRLAGSHDPVFFTDTHARAASEHAGLPVGRELELQLGEAGRFDGDTEEIISYHVTDSGSRVVAVLEDEGRTLVDGYTGPDNELGPGLYASAAPERWLNRAQRKWAFAHRLTEEQRGLVVDKLRAEIDSKSPGHLSQVEIERALRDLEHIRTGDLDPDQLRRFAEQPFNIQLWREGWLADLGIDPGQAPKKVEVRAKGKFANLSREPLPDGARIRQLMDRGFDGAFIDGARGRAPQLVIWNKRAITQFGDWRAEGRLDLDNLSSKELVARRERALLRGEGVNEIDGALRRRVGRILEVHDPVLSLDDTYALNAVRGDSRFGEGLEGDLHGRTKDWFRAQSDGWQRNRSSQEVRLGHEIHQERIQHALDYYDEAAPGWREGKAWLELEGIRHNDGRLQTVYTVTPDAREPGRFRMTIQRDDGPFGHITFDTMEEAARYALLHHGSPGRLVTGTVDEWALTPKYQDGMERIAALEKVNARAAEATFGKRNTDLSAAELRTEGELKELVEGLEARMLLAGRNDTHCTTCANTVLEEFGRGEVWGYSSVQNPDAKLGRVVFGHDFLIVDNAFLVDPWGVNIDGRVPSPVLHLVRDAEIIREFYGDPERWSALNKFDPEDFHSTDYDLPDEYQKEIPRLRGSALAGESIELDRPSSQIVDEFQRARSDLLDAVDASADPTGQVFKDRAIAFLKAERRLELVVEGQRIGQPSASSTKVVSEVGSPLSTARSAESGKPSSQSPAVSRGSTSQAPLDQRSTTTTEPGASASSRTTGPLKSENLGAPKTRTGEPPHDVGELVIHPETGETWIAFHATDNIQEIIANGYRSLPRFKADLERALDGRGTLFGVRVKAELELDANGKPQFDENGIVRFVSDENGNPVPSTRQVEKAALKYPNGSNQFAGDAVGGRLWVDRLEQVQDIVDALERLGYRVLENEDFLFNEVTVSKKLGYRARHLILRHEAFGGVAYELQIMSRETGAVQEQAHQYFESARAQEATTDDVLAARAGSEALYGPAHQAYLDRVEVEGPIEPKLTPRETALELGPTVPGVYGRRIELIVGPEGQRVSGRYKVVEADDVIPSHRWDDFQRDERHPGNERGYHRDKNAQAHVDKIAREHDPGQTLMVTESPAMGPPIIRSDGVVPGGNGRVEAIQRMYALYPEAAEGYRSELQRRVGIDHGVEDPVTTYKKPMLVFEVDESPTDLAGWNKLVADLNFDPQKALDPLSDSFRRGRRLRESETALAELSAKMPPDMTLRAFLDTSDGEAWFSTLVREGIIDGNELGAFVKSSTMNLTREGKDALERMVLGAAFSDVDAINAAPPKSVQQLGHSVPAIVRVNQIPGYELGEIVQEALELLSRVYQKNAEGRRLFGTAADYFSQGDLLAGRGHSEEAEILARFIDENGVRNTTAGFRRYATEAEHALETGSMAGGADLFGAKAKARGELIDIVFGDGTVRKTPEPVGFGLDEAGRLSLPFGREPPKPGEPKVTFDDPDMETRWNEAGEPQVRTFRDKVRDTLETIRHSGRRRFEHLASGPRWEVARFELLRLMKQSDVAVERGIRRLERITKMMDPQEYDLFVRKVVLDDLAEELRINPDHELPFGLTPETLELERIKVETAVLETPNVREAIEARHGEWAELREKYVAQMERIGVNLDERFQREDYYHHQVVEKTRENRRLRTVNSELKTPTRRGFLKRRVGSDADISTDYLAAEFEVMAQLEYDMEVARTLEKIQGEYDIYDRVRATAKDAGTKWQDEIPDGYTVYRAREGTTFYRAYSVPERLAVNLLEAARKTDDAFATLTADEIREVLAKGGPFKPMVVPDEIARTLDNLPTGPKEALARLSSKTLGLWKEWQLISPRRYLKYNLRNLSGDIEVTLTGNFRAFRQVRQATRELYGVFTGKPMPAHMRDWFERGGMQTTLQVQEIGDIHNLDKVLNNLSGEKPNLVRRAWDKYWRFARESTDFREAILRYANYLEYLQQMRSNKGRPLNFGASMPEEVLILPDIRDRAFKMSNELVGAYDQISVAGAHIRRHFIPFWSFQEINMRRYTQMIKNAARDDELALQVGRRLLGKAVTSPLTAVRVGAFAIKATGMWMGLQVYNNMMWGELEDQLPPEIQGKPHIILGSRDDGTIRVFTRLGALGDFLEWFGLDTPVDMASDWLNGRRTTNEIIADMAKAPVNKIVGGITPVAQYPFTLLTRRTLWPDAFKPGTVRDRAGYLAQSIGLENEFKALTDRPTDRSYLESLRTLPYYEVDPGESAVWYIIEEKSRFKRRRGEYSEGFFINPKSNALWNLKKALRYEDKDAMMKYLLDYADLGGTEAGLKGAFKSLHPLAGLSLEKGENGEVSELEEFLTQMRQEDRDRLKVALAWYDEVMGSRPADEER